MAADTLLKQPFLFSSFGGLFADEAHVFSFGYTVFFMKQPSFLFPF